MQILGIWTNVINWIKSFYSNATASVNLNRSPGQSFSIKGGVRQGCPLAPYLFLIVGKALIFMIKKIVIEGRLREITLPGDKKQQSISQYADNSSFVVRGEKRYVDKLVTLLKAFIRLSEWKSTGTSLVPIGSTNLHTSRSDL